MIPHIIHYCWFGENTKSKMIMLCIESWQKFFPNWEIIEWNESNYDINKNQYLRDAYELKKWAFVSDYARFDVLREYGGIYLDVDVEFIKPLPDYMLKYQCFSGFQKSGEVSPGLIFGSIPNHWFLDEILETYNNDRFVYNKDGIYKTVNTRTSEILSQYGLLIEDSFQTIVDIHIFPSEFFCAYDTDIREPEITDKTICWHHYLGSWNQKATKTKLQDILKKIVGVNNYRKILLLKRKIKR